MLLLQVFAVLGVIFLIIFIYSLVTLLTSKSELKNVIKEEKDKDEEKIIYHVGEFVYFRGSKKKWYISKVFENHLYITKNNSKLLVKNNHVKKV